MRDAKDTVPYNSNSIAHNETGEVPLYHIGLEECEERCVCERCGGEGFIEYNDGDGGDWGEDCPSEENHLITCRASSRSWRGVEDSEPNTRWFTRKTVCPRESRPTIPISNEHHDY